MTPSHPCFPLSWSVVPRHQLLGAGRRNSKGEEHKWIQFWGEIDFAWGEKLFLNKVNTCIFLRFRNELGPFPFPKLRDGKIFSAESRNTFGWGGRNLGISWLRVLGWRGLHRVPFPLVCLYISLIFFTYFSHISYIFLICFLYISDIFLICFLYISYIFFTHKYILLNWEIHFGAGRNLGSAGGGWWVGGACTGFPFLFHHRRRRLHTRSTRGPTNTNPFSQVQQIQMWELVEIPEICSYLLCKGPTTCYKWTFSGNILQISHWWKCFIRLYDSPF